MLSASLRSCIGLASKKNDDVSTVGGRIISISFGFLTSTMGFRVRNFDVQATVTFLFQFFHDSFYGAGLRLYHDAASVTYQ